MSGTRSRHGCWTCRRRHQKCDEDKPACKNCRSRNAECGGYAIELADFSIYNGPQGQMVSKMTRGRPAVTRAAKPRTRQPRGRRIPSSSTASTTSTTNSDSIALKGHAKEVPASNPTTGQDEPAIVENDQLPNELLLWLSVGSPKASSPQQDMLLTDTKDSDFNGDGVDFLETALYEDLPAAPIIDFMSNNEGIAQWQLTDTRQIDRDEHIQQEIELPDLSDMLTLIRPNTLLEDRLLHHFMNNLSVCLYPAEANRNPYRNVYGNLAKECKPLLDTVFFASAMHLSKLGQLKNSEIRPFRMALQTSFREALQWEHHSWALGLTVLLSIVSDVIGTGMDSWSSKLIGCRRLLEMGLSRTQGPIDASQKCVVMQFNWMATMGKTMLLGVHPLHTLQEIKCINRAELLPNEQLDEAEMAFQQQHWWANMPDFRMHLLLRQATDLSAEIHLLKEEGGRMENLLQVMPRVADLVHKIENWHPDLSAVSPEYATSVQHFNELWRQGMLCYVYHEIYYLGSDDVRIQKLRRVVLRGASKPELAPSMLMAVFMLAVHAKTAASRSCFEAGLMDMHTTLGFTAPKSLVLILHRIWDSADSGSQSRWKDILRGLGIELNILL